jgi:phage terminase large subunit-like protein
VTELERFKLFAAEFLTDEQDARLVIEPWQEEVLEGYFSGARETVVVVSKKNGKTSLFAALALFHLLTVRFADVAILAAARDQAGKLLAQLVGYVRRNESLRRRVRITQRTVHCDATRGKVAVLAADSDTLDGWGGTLALVDELGRHKSEENFGLLRDGLGPRDGRLIAFSTAGDNEESALGKIREAAHGMDGFERDPSNAKHKRIRTARFQFHEWSLDPGDDPDDLELVLLANPASWIDRDELEQRRASPSMRRWQWQRFTCGLWVTGEESAIAPTEWAACGGAGALAEGEKGVVVGIDLGWRWDTTAFVPMADVAGARLVGEPTILTPPQDGTSLDAEDVFAVAELYAKRYPGCLFTLDPEAGGEQLGQRIEKQLAGVEVVTFSQKAGQMCAASQRLAEDIAARRIRHPDHEELTRHVLAAAAKFVGPMWRVVKPKRRGTPIDGAIALTMANDVLASRAPRRRSVYEQRGLVTF